jgi:single-stranded DNA-specific DHH superfamily exonuclease
MEYIDVFNGDADGICALHILRLHEPRPDARRVSGVKRDIALLDRLADVPQARVTVLDISLDRNREGLETLLANGNRVLYVDHHYAGTIPESPLLTAHINPDPLVCTSLLANDLTHGQHAAWAVVGAFGDNLDEPASQLATRLGLDEAETAQLRETGILLNYNGYGASLDDLFFDPAELFLRVHSYVDPLTFAAESRTLETLRRGYREDMDRAMASRPIHEDGSGRIYELPPQAWARRVAGVYANRLAREKPELAHALVTANTDGSLRISVRAPLARRSGADTLCRSFPTGGGRAAAAGINELPPDMLDSFIAAFSANFAP